MRGYLFDRTKQNKGIFWNSVKPFFTNKSGAGSGEIIISENNKIISEQSEIAEILCKRSCRHWERSHSF